MTTDKLRYAILDSNCTKLNVIFVDNPYPEGYYPPVGSYITCEYGEPDPIPPENVNITDKFTYLTVRPMDLMVIGDTMNIYTGEVTKAPVDDNPITS